MVAPPPLAERVLAALERHQSVLNVVRLPDAARRPRGDLILCDVAREDASVVLADLRRLGLGDEGTIAIETIDTAISTAARAAEEAAAGSPADAVVWEEVESRTSESAELSGSFLAFMLLATMIAAVGILTDSVILIIGARSSRWPWASRPRSRSRTPARSSSAPPTKAPPSWPTIRRRSSSRAPIFSR